MKILKPRISIVILSICFFIGSAEILTAPYDAKAADPVKTKGKDASGSKPKTTDQPAVPEGAREATSTAPRKNTAKTGENTTETPSRKLSDTDISRPSTPNEFTSKKAITKTVQGDNGATQSSKLKLTAPEATSDFSIQEADTATSQAPEAPKNLFEIEETASAEKSLFKTEELARTDKTIKSENRLEKSNQEKSDIDATKSTLSKMIESFKKIIESITRTLNQDKTITPEQRADFKNKLDENKKALKNLEEFKKLPDDLRTEHLAKIEDQVSLVKDQLSSILMRAKPDSTIYKDLSKALDDLDTKTAQEIKDSAAKKREKIALLRDDFNEIRRDQIVADINERQGNVNQNSYDWQNYRKHLDEIDNAKDAEKKKYLNNELLKYDTFKNIDQKEINALKKSKKQTNV